jgi:hypothetical protein
MHVHARDGARLDQPLNLGRTLDKDVTTAVPLVLPGHSVAHAFGALASTGIHRQDATSLSTPRRWGAHAPEDRVGGFLRASAVPPNSDTNRYYRAREKVLTALENTRA